MRLVLCFLMFCASGFADPSAVGRDIVILPADQTVHGNYYALGDSVEISGTVTGDVYVLGGQVFIDGHVQGDVLALGASVEISGTVGNNIRVLGGQVTLSGDVEKNITVLTGNFQVMPSADLKGNLVCIAGNADIASSVAEDVTVFASNLRVSNELHKNLEAYVGQFRLTSKAVIDGDVTYGSNTVAMLDPAAKILGQVTYESSYFSRFFEGSWIKGLLFGSKVATLLMNFFYSLITGLILIRLFPKTVDCALQALKAEHWKAFIYGLVLLVLLPLASLILLMTILGAPFALTLIAFNIIGFYTAKIFTILWSSDAVFRKFKLKPSRSLTLCLGLVVYFLLTSIPIFGTVVALVTMLFGVGAAVIGRTLTPTRRRA